MIDFRYHLVSIVSIFMALAVGIVLGAGPLKGGIGSTLTQELTQLRQDKTDLRGQLSAAQSGSDARDAYAAEVAPLVTRDALAGKTVTIVVLPGANGDVVRSTTASVIGAGAKIGSTVTVSDSWADPANRTFRNKLAENLAALVKAPTGASSPDQLPATILALSILSGTDQAIERTAPGASQVLDGLKEGKLLTYAPDQIAPSSAVVLVAGPVKGKDDEDTKARLQADLLLASVLDARCAGSVLISTSADSEARSSTALVAAVRSDSTVSKAVSTVDDADLPMGQSTAVLALAQQYTGVTGHYGLAGDAKAVVPDVAASK